MPHAIQAPSKLGFPGLSFLPSPLTWRRIAISTPPWSRFCEAITLPTTRRSFAVRAESDPEEGAAEASEESAGAEDAEETASESEAPEAEVEERPPRKPRVKLGEIMGVIDRTRCVVRMNLAVALAVLDVVLKKT
ncbi:hypothetical protein ACLOJK_030493 [Asimina triloba]